MSTQVCVKLWWTDVTSQSVSDQRQVQNQQIQQIVDLDSRLPGRSRIALYCFDMCITVLEVDLTVSFDTVGAEEKFLCYWMYINTCTHGDGPSNVCITE